MPLPASLPTWATGLLRRIEPEVLEKASGFVASKRSAPRKTNWIIGLLCDWVEYLRDERDRLDAYCAATGVVLPATVTTVRFVGPMSALLTDPADWTVLSGSMRSEANGAVVSFDLTTILPRNGTIRKVYVLVNPGINRATVVDRITANLTGDLYGVSFAAPVVTAPVLVTETDDGSTDLQWIEFDLTGAPVLVAAAVTWRVNVIASTLDADTNKDFVYAAAVEFQCATIRNG